jgi:hypothetical protein
MSDFYKCKHDQQMCGTCTRGLKVQYEELFGRNAALEKQVEKLREALKDITKLCVCDTQRIAYQALSEGSEE